jgi:hypothetical protein
MNLSLSNNSMMLEPLVPPGFEKTTSAKFKKTVKFANEFSDIEDNIATIDTAIIAANITNEEVAENDTNATIDTIDTNTNEEVAANDAINTNAINEEVAANVTNEVAAIKEVAANDAIDAIEEVAANNTNGAIEEVAANAAIDVILPFSHNLKKINLSSLNKIINDKISIYDDNSIYLIFDDGFMQKINGESKKNLLLSIKRGLPNIFFKTWEFTTFIHTSHQELLIGDKVMESIYLYCPNNKLSHELLCKKFKLNNRAYIILVVDLYKIDEKNLFDTFGLDYLNELSFDEIISKYHKLNKEIKTLFNDFYSIDCPKCGCITSINFMRIFPKTVTFCKCAKCRHFIK